MDRQVSYKFSVLRFVFEMTEILLKGRKILTHPSLGFVRLYIFSIVEINMHL